jgi:MscS family membrane protein
MTGNLHRKRGGIDLFAGCRGRDLVRLFFVAVGAFLTISVAGAAVAQPAAYEKFLQPSVLLGGKSLSSSDLDKEIEGRIPNLQELLRDYPIAPPDSKSPRASLESFLVLMAEASRIWIALRNEFLEGDTLFLSEDQKRRLAIVQLLISKATELFDLSDVPQTARENVGIETVLQFQEIIDRIYMPSLEDVPGKAAGAPQDPDFAATLPQRWRLPGTGLIFAQTGTEKGDVRYLVSKETVARIPQDYAAVRVFPSHSDKGEDLYAYYIYTPGNLVPPRWYDLVLEGPQWLRHEFRDQAVWQWLALGLLAILSIVIPVSVQRWNRWRAVPLSDVRRRMRRMQLPLVVLLTAVGFRFLANDQVNITGVPMVIVGTVSATVLWASVSWFCYQAIDLLASWVMKNPTAPTASLDSSLLLSGFRLIGLALSVVLLGYGATQIGIPVYGVIAGLGVGGLAVALAAQPTLENLIGGVILYADRMVRVGEYCEFEGLSGTVEAIGIRSTRIRALDRTLITVANSDLAKRKIVNFSRRDRFLLNHVISLRRDTDAAVLLSIIEKIRLSLEENPKVLDQMALRVTFVGFGDYSLNIELFTYISTADRNEFLKIQEQILVEITRIVQQGGSNFAFPSNVTYLGRDHGLPQQVAAGGAGQDNPTEEGAS